MIPRARLWYLVRIALGVSALVILFFSGIFPLEDLFTTTPGLSASIAASDVASLTNEQRIQNGLPPLAVSPLLTDAAQMKAEDMAQNSYYAHVGPDGKTPLYWLDHAGYHYLNAGENLVIDRTTSEQAISAWMNSPDHRENILRPQFTEIGIGVAKGQFEGVDTIFVVQEFGTPYPTARAIVLAPKPVPVKAAPEPVPASTPTPTVIATPVKPSIVPVLTIPSVSKQTTVPHVASFKPRSVAISAAVTSSIPTIATTTGQGSSTVSFALAPEFYKPVTLSAAQNRADAAQSAAPQGTSVSAISVLIERIKSYFGHIFHTAS